MEASEQCIMVKLNFALILNKTASNTLRKVANQNLLNHRKVKRWKGSCSETFV